MLEHNDELNEPYCDILPTTPPPPQPQPPCGAPAEALPQAILFGDQKHGTILQMAARPLG